MGSSLPILLSFGLCLSLEITAHGDTLSKPVLWAKPRSVVARGTDVILWCQGPPEVEMYRLERLSPPRTYQDVPGFLGSGARFPLGRISGATAGLYRCSYRNGDNWSPPSNQLELVVTGLYPKASLSILPDTEVSAGQNVTFSCNSELGFDTFAVAQEGRAGIWKVREGKPPVHFPLPSVKASHTGTYWCYGFDSHLPYLWTTPSDPLELRVKETLGTPSLIDLSKTSAGAPTSPHISPEKVDVPTGATPQDYTVSNLVRLVLAGLVVAVLGGFLAEAWQAWRGKLHALPGPLFQAQVPTASQVKGLPP
ncbi:platelet glycoprotein VI-like isoform X1 [Macrotis lagotis]|uniref:platelet glycoprotein VI-like isoform X1 n=1 Tax=Macrotis lagotis TaxID=92651 RepID=UPI003D697B82